jgi:hypothetical protein
LTSSPDKDILANRQGSYVVGPQHPSRVIKPRQGSWENAPSSLDVKPMALCVEVGNISSRGLVKNQISQSSTKLPQSNTHLNKPSQSYTNLQKTSPNKPYSQTFPSAYRFHLRQNNSGCSVSSVTSVSPCEKFVFRKPSLQAFPSQTKQ